MLRDCLSLQDSEIKGSNINILCKCEEAMKALFVAEETN